jgi:protein-disulfide isomerase
MASLNLFSTLRKGSDPFRRVLRSVDSPAPTLKLALSRLLQLGLVLALAAVVVVGAVVLSSNGGDTETPAADQPTESGKTMAQEVEELYAGISQKGNLLGKRDAPATVVEIADLQCPFCAQYSVQSLPTIVRDYVRTGKVNYELRIRSFLGRDSVRGAGAAAAAAEQDRMFQFADLFFRNQGPENSDYADDAFMRMVAEQVPGLDADAVVAAADDPLAQPAVERDELYARKIGSTSTPDFYLKRGERLTPITPQGTSPEDYAAAIDAALASSS